MKRIPKSVISVNHPQQHKEKNINWKDYPCKRVDTGRKLPRNLGNYFDSWKDYIQNGGEGRMKLVTQKEFCRMFKISRQTFQNWVHEKDSPLQNAAFKIGRCWRVDIKKYLQFTQGKEKMMKHRSIWVKDIVKILPPSKIYIRKNYQEIIARGEKCEVYDEQDSQFSRLLKKDGLRKIDVIYCEFAISIGNAGCSLEPFISVEEALTWISENAGYLYFGKWTNPELRKQFPQIPVQEHPSETEKRFGISEFDIPNKVSGLKKKTQFSRKDIY